MTMRPAAAPRSLLGRSVALSLLFAAFALSAVSAETPDARASDLLGVRASGANYRVLEKVAGDGRNRIWTVESTFGTFKVTGDALLEVRLRELDVLSKLEETSFGEKVVTSVSQSMLAPLIFGGELLTSPVETLKGTLSGIEQMFDRFSTSSETGSSPESFAGGLLGVDAARRKIAAEIDVDPHTDFAPLADRLSVLARGSAVGSMTVGAAMKIAVPGTLALSYSGVTASKSVKDALREKTAGQLLRDAREVLGSLGVPVELAERLTANGNYTPTDLYVVAAALQRLAAARTDMFVRAASGATTRSGAYLYRMQADMMAARAEKTPQPRAFMTAPGITLLRTGDDQVFAFVPADEFLWNKQNAKAADDVGKFVASHAPQAKRVVVLAGTPGERARQELTTRGWVIEQIGLHDLVVNTTQAAVKPATEPARSPEIPLPPKPRR